MLAWSWPVLRGFAWERRISAHTNYGPPKRVLVFQIFRYTEALKSAAIHKYRRPSRSVPSPWAGGLVAPRKPGAFIRRTRDEAG